MSDQEFDYVIVGAGSAGCVLANRLTASGQHTVLLLEFGGSDQSIFIQMPAALSIPMNQPRYNWGFVSEPEPGLGGRRVQTPRGKVIGGSSSINGMVYVRGNPFDFDRWEEEGASGWNYAQVLPYFKRAETRAAGGDAYRGDSGPLLTQYGSLTNPLNEVWVQAGRQAGYKTTDDINGFSQEGIGKLDMTVGHGRRWSAANAYIKPIRSRQNLVIRTQALVTRVEFAQQRAVAVHYQLDGVPQRAAARREVILSAGPINSPKLLMLSGVGAGSELQALGIPVVADRPGVGQNLQDHLEFYFQVACREPITLFGVQDPWHKALIGLRWLLRKDGLGASNHFETGGFIRSRPGIRYPDIQFHFLPMAVSYDGSSLAKEHGFQAHAGPMRSRSRGKVWLDSPDPVAAPRILFNYMSHPDDWLEMRACVRLTREIFAQPAFDRYRGREINPGSEVQTDEQIDAFIRQHVETAYHPSCSCKMGAANDPLAVVDADTRVIGTTGLRVVDSSIMPSITTGNLNAPTIMLAEKASDHILGGPLLPAANVPVYEAPQWRDSQR